MPVTFFEGVRPDQRADLSRKNIERRFYALAAAVKEHEARVRRDSSEVTRQDEDLYRRLREICGERRGGEERRAAR